MYNIEWTYVLAGLQQAFRPFGPVKVEWPNKDDSRIQRNPPKGRGKSTVQKLKFSIKDFISKCDQICRKLRIWSHLLKKSLMENFIFCAVVFFYRSNHSQILFKKIGILKNFAIITTKNMCWSLFLVKLQAWKPQHKCFPVKISKFLRTAFLIENSFFPVAASRKWRISLLTLFHAGLNVVLPLRSRLPSFRLSWKPFWRGNSLLFL